MAFSRRRIRGRRPAGRAVVTTMALVSLTVPARSVWWWVAISVGGIAILLMLVNRLLLPAVTGWSLGRAFFGIAVVRRDGEAPGAWGLLLRDLAHLLDTASLLVGWLWPLWDSRRRTFADMLLRTEVRRVERRRAAARHMAVDRCGGADRCGGVPGGCRLELRGGVPHDRATDQTAQRLPFKGQRSSHRCSRTTRNRCTTTSRAPCRWLPTNIAASWPLSRTSCRKGTRSSTSTGRPTAQFSRRARIGRRCCCSCTVGEATGRDERYISATVRVSFVKGADNRWRVDDLTVLTKPKPPGPENESPPQVSARRGTTARRARGPVRRRWGLPLAAAVAALLMAAAITVSTLMLISHESHHRADRRTARYSAT